MGLDSPNLGFWLTDDSGHVVVDPPDGSWVTVHGAGFLDGRHQVSNDWFDRFTRGLGSWLDKNAETIISTGAGVVGFLAGGPVGAGLASAGVMAAFGAMKKATGQGTTEQEEAAARGLFMSAAEAGTANIDTTDLNLTDMGDGELGLDSDSAEILVAQGKAKVVDGAAHVVAGNPDAQITIVAFGGAAPQSYQATNLYGNQALYDMINPDKVAASNIYGSTGAQALLDSFSLDDSGTTEGEAPAEKPFPTTKVLLFLAGATAFAFLVSRKG